MAEFFHPDSLGYEAIRRPVNPAFRNVFPRLLIRCHSVSDVVEAVAYGRELGVRVVPRGGGHCFAGRSSTGGIVLDMSGLDGISVAADGGIATIGAGARLGQVYEGLHAFGRTLPAGCGPTVGIAGLTLGGGIGLLGRQFGLTCDRLVGARVVLADGNVVDCDSQREPDLFWALRGAGGGQFGIVTSLIFDTVPEPITTRIEAQWPDIDVESLVATWQAWAPDAPDELTINLTLSGTPVRATLFGAATLDEGLTRSLLHSFPPGIVLRGGLPFHRLKNSLAGPPSFPASRSEFFSRALSDASLLSEGLGSGRLTFTAMGGAYNRVAADATAFAHRDSRFLLEHIGDPAWVDRSWAVAHPDGSGSVYPNFPDPALDDWATAYHGGNFGRLAAVKKAYDRDRFFDFPQAV
jgi:hypothetical protein